MGRPRFAAHRGGAALWPENSLLAIGESIALGAPLVEMDVHLTADGGLAVIHDGSLDRTTDGTGRVAERTVAELRARRLKGPDGVLSSEHVPMFEEVLALLAPSPSGLLLEVKGPGVPVRYERVAGGVRRIPGPRYGGLEELALRALETHGMIARTSVLAFNPDVLARCRALAPGGPRRTLLVAARLISAAGARADETIAWAVEIGATDVGLEATLVDEHVVRAARAAGIGIGVWTVNDETEMRRFEALEVDIVTTDRPDIARRVLGPA